METAVPATDAMALGAPNLVTNSEPEGRVRIRPMRAADADRVGSLRDAAFEEGLLRRLGPAATAALYRAAVRDERGSFALVAEGVEGLLGFLLVTEDATALQRSALRSSRGIVLEALRRMARDPSSWIAVIGRVGRIVFVWPRPSAGGEQQPRLRLLDVGVDPRVRGQGIGHGLIRSALEKARARGHSEIGLSVEASNLGALELYRSAGFVESGRGRASEGREYVLLRRSLSG